jgi:hypothetical protein
VEVQNALLVVFALVLLVILVSVFCLGLFLVRHLTTKVLLVPIVTSD